MPISKTNSDKIVAMFDRAFKRGSCRNYDRQPDGGFARIAATVDSISKPQLLEIAKVANEVPDSVGIRRSGTDVTIYFY